MQPMNYRHAYHAGNFADVFKHAALIELLESFKAKPTPFCYLDTHAGRGVYELGGEQARKTGEAADGVLRLLAAPDVPAPLHAYVDLVRSMAGQHDVTGGLRYPGSPLVADALLRDQDGAVLCELQPEEAGALRALFARRKSFHVHQRDGYEALRALLPPKERRGLVLIDPPFENRKDEFRIIRSALEDALTRWPTGRYAVWYPIKLGRDIQPFRRWLQRRCPGQWLVGEFLIHPDNTDLRLNGCGLALINPPWRFEHALDDMLTALCEHLAQDGYGEKRIDC